MQAIYLCAASQQPDGVQAADARQQHARAGVELGRL